MDTKESLQLRKSEIVTTLQSLKNGSLPELKDARECTSIRSAYNSNKAEIKTFMAVEIKRVVDFLEMKKTLKTSEEYIFTVEALIENEPQMTISEFALLFKEMKKGRWDFFERLKTPEFLKCARDFYSQDVVDVIMRKHQEEKDKEKNIEPIKSAKDLYKNWTLPKERDKWKKYRTK